MHGILFSLHKESGPPSKKLQAIKASNTIRNEKSISENNTNASVPIFIDVTAIEEYGTHLPGSQNKRKIG